MPHANHQGEPGDRELAHWAKQIAFYTDGIGGAATPTVTLLRDLAENLNGRKIIENREGWARGLHSRADLLEEAAREIRKALASAPTPPDRVGEEVGRDPDRLLKDALFACLRSGTGGREYGGVAAEGGKFAWVRFSVEGPSPDPAGAGGDLEELERLSAAASQGDIIAEPYTDDHGGCYLMAGEIQIAAGLTEEDGAYLAALARNHRSGKLVRSTGSGKEETKGADEPFQPKIETCPKCQAQGVAFICDQPGCPVNGGAAYPWTPEAAPQSSPSQTPVDPQMTVEANPPRWRDLKWCQANYPHLKWTISGEPSKPVWWDDEYGWTYPHNCLPPMPSAQCKGGA